MGTASPFDLSGRVALVTGASRGIGESIVRTLAAAGARVIVSSRKLDACEAVAASICEAGGEAAALACHIGELAEIDRLFKAIEAGHGRLDILVNNAATNPHYGPITSIDPAAFQKTVDVNIRGYFYASVLAGRMMREQGGGSIINVASVNGIRPGPMQGIYSITKTAVIGMTKSFAKECGTHGIRVNALVPGLIRTKFAGALLSDAEQLQHYLGTNPLGRVGEPVELAGAALFLASGASSYVTGHCLAVDGGFLV